MTAEGNDASDGLREAIAEALADEGLTPGEGIYADAVLALPELAALRAKAAATDRVRELHTPLDRGTGPRCQGCSTHVTFTPWPCATVRALDGPAPC